MTATGNVHRLPNRDAALKALYDDVSAKHMFPFWATSTDVEHDEVKQLLATAKRGPISLALRGRHRTNPESGGRIGHDGRFERRSLILVNPGLAPQARDREHDVHRLSAQRRQRDHAAARHSPSAVRFGLKGKGNFTGVDGENIVFGPGDMVLTPNDTWHNHGTVGNEQALNLSVLDLPLVETLNAVHFDHDYKEEENGKVVPKKQQTERFLVRLLATHLWLWRPDAALSPASKSAAPASPRRCSSTAGR